MSNRNNNRTFTIQLFTVLRNEDHEEDSDLIMAFIKASLKKRKKYKKRAGQNIESETKRRNYEEESSVKWSHSLFLQAFLVTPALSRWS